MFCTVPLLYLCPALLGHCALHCHFWGTAPLVHYALYCPSWAMICTAPLGHCPFWVLCFVLPPGALYTALCTVLCTSPIFGLYFHCPSSGTMLCALLFWVSVLCSANLHFLFGHCALHCLSVAVLHYPSGNCALYFLTVLLRALCSVHCPSGAFLLCTPLWCPVLCTGSDSGLPFWSSVLCPTHNVHYASVQPFLGHCALQCPFSALCSAQPFLGFALYCPYGAPCSALLFLGVVFLHCPSWALCPPLPSGVLCFSLPL